MNKNPHRPSAADLLKRRGDRRRLVLQALLSAARQHEEDRDVSRGLTPLELAKAWRLHPSSVYSCLQRLARAGAVLRQGVGLGAEYGITRKGQDKLAWLNEVEAARAKFRKRTRRAAANPEEDA